MIDPVGARRIIHTIHAVRDMDGSRMQYQDILGGLCFSEGYEPSADRDMALIYVTDHMIEPMAPRSADDLGKSFARYLHKNGEGWHSFEIKVDSAAEAAARFKAAGCKLIESPYPVFFFVRAESTGGILLEVCEVPMRNDPFDRRNWNPAWAEGLQSGLLRLDHIACVVTEIEQSLHFFTELVDGAIVTDDRISQPQPARRVMINLGGTRVALIAPDDPTGGALAGKSGIYALVWQVEDEGSARADLEGNGLSIVTEGCVGGGFAIDPNDFRNARHEFKSVA